MFVGQSAGLRVRIWWAGAFVGSQRSAIWHKDRDRAGVNGPAA